MVLHLRSVLLFEVVHFIAVNNNFPYSFFFHIYNTFFIYLHTQNSHTKQLTIIVVVIAVGSKTV